MKQKFFPSMLVRFRHERAIAVPNALESEGIPPVLYHLNMPHSSATAPQSAPSKRPTREGSERQEAWIGDAVLTLHARLRILDSSGEVNAELCSRMTSNRFLSAFGEPTSVEARVGRVFRDQGLDAAFEWVESELMPLFLRQQEKRARKAGR